MKARLKRVHRKLYYHDVNDDLHVVDPRDSTTFPPGLSGDLFGLRGDATGLYGYVYVYANGISGDVSGIYGRLLNGGGIRDLYGDVSGLHGNVTGVFGEATGLHGDLDDCALTDEDRHAGVDIATLVAEEEK